MASRLAIGLKHQPYALQKMFQVWAGTDACEPVTWQEGKLVPKEVKFIVPEMNCKEKQELWYHEPEEVKPADPPNFFSS